MLGITRTEDETWLDCALRYGRKYGLEEEVDFEYHILIGEGVTPEEAAWGACLEWDILDLHTTNEVQE